MTPTPPPESGAHADGIPARRGRGRPRDPDTDHRITSAAAQLMLQRGFDKTTVDDVAALAGVGKATVYRRWPSKEDLVVSAMETIFESEMPEPDTGSIVTDLAASYLAVLTFVNTAEGEAFLRTTIAESVRDPRIATLHRLSTERREGLHRATFVRAIERGEVRADADIDAAVQWLGGLLSVRAITNRPMPTIADLDSLVQFTLHGVLIHP